jgi:hypothetical protein
MVSDAIADHELHESAAERSPRSATEREWVPLILRRFFTPSHSHTNQTRVIGQRVSQIRHL